MNPDNLPALFTPFTLRVVSVSLVVLALCRPVLRLDKADQAVVFAVDVSDSLESSEIEKCAAWIATATRELPSNRRAALLAFGGFLVMLAAALWFERNARRLGKAGVDQLTQSMRAGGLKDYFGSTGDKMRQRFQRDE